MIWIKPNVPIARSLAFFAFLAGSAWAGDAGLVDSSFEIGDGPNSTVQAIAISPSGKIAVGGQFTMFNSVNHAGIVQLLADGAIDETFDTTFSFGGVPDIVQMQYQPDEKLLVRYRTLSSEGLTVLRLIRLLTNGDLDSSFNPPFEDPNTVTSLSLQSDGKIVVTGILAITGEGTTRSVARLEVNGSLDPTFVGLTLAGGTPTAGAVVGDNSIWIGTDYVAFNGSVTTRLHRLFSNGALDTSYFFPTSASTIVAIRPAPAGRVIVASTRQIRSFELNGQSAPWFNEFSRNTPGIFDVAINAQGSIFVGGTFGDLEKYLLRLSMDGYRDSEFAPTGGPNAQVLALSVDQFGRLLVGGAFTMVGADARPYLSRLTGDLPQEVAPEIVNEPSDQTLNVGEAFSLSVEATGFPLHYFWYKDTAALQGEQSPVLQISAAGLADSGLYQVLVSNALGVASSRLVSVSVNPYPIRIDNHPEAAAVLELSDHELDIDLFGTPPVTYQWWKENNPLSGENNATLQFKRILREQAGNYHVVVSNPAGSVTSLVATITVESLPPQPDHPGALDVYRNLPGLDDGLNSAALLRLDDGKVLLYGTRDGDGGSPTAYLKRLDPDGRDDVTFSFTVTSGDLAISPPLQLISGRFLVSMLSSSGFSYLRRIDLDGNDDNSFASPGAIDGTVSSMVERPDGRIILGGRFHTVGGLARTNLFQILPNGTLDPGFNAGAVPLASLAIANLKLQPDGALLYSEGSSCCSPPRLLTRLHENGTRDTSFNPTVGTLQLPPPFVSEILVQPDGKIVVSGDFDVVNGVSRPHLVRLTSGGALDDSFELGTGPDYPVNSMVLLEDHSFLVGGFFNSINSIPRRMLARIDASGTLDPAMYIPTNPSDEPASISDITVLLDGGLAILGSFESISGVPRKWFAILRGSDATIPSREPIINSAIFDSEGRLHFLLGGRPGRAYRLQSSDDLINWVDIHEFLAHPTQQQFTDSDSSLSGHRAYRVLLAH